MLWLTFIIFTIAPVMASFFMYLLKDPELVRQSGFIGAQSQIKSEFSWEVYFIFLTQIVAVGGIIVFGFVISWIFGREYTDRTITDLLALPFPRIYIPLAKLVTSAIVCFLLTIYIVVVGVLLGWLIDIPKGSLQVFSVGITNVFVAMCLTILLSTPVAFFACYGKGYLAPLGFVIIMIVCSQIIGALGYGHYFPWSIPAFFGGLYGDEQGLPFPSVVMIITTGFIGICATFIWWKVAEAE